MVKIINAHGTEDSFLGGYVIDTDEKIARKDFSKLSEEYRETLKSDDYVAFQADDVSKGGNRACFSNYSKHPVVINGITYPTTEHYFQMAKMDPKADGYKEAFSEALKMTPGEVRKACGKDGKFTADDIAKDWPGANDEEKVAFSEKVMERALEAKFAQNPEALRALLATGNKTLIEVAPYDPIWGIGEDGKGGNLLGSELSKIRGRLHAEMTAATDGKPELSELYNDPKASGKLIETYIGQCKAEGRDVFEDMGGRLKPDEASKKLSEAKDYSKTKAAKTGSEKDAGDIEITGASSGKSSKKSKETPPPYVSPEQIKAQKEYNKLATHKTQNEGMDIDHGRKREGASGAGAGLKDSLIGSKSNKLLTLGAVGGCALGVAFPLVLIAAIPLALFVFGKAGYKAHAGARDAAHQNRVENLNEIAERKKVNNEFAEALGLDPKKARQGLEMSKEVEQQKKQEAEVAKKDKKQQEKADEAEEKGAKKQGKEDKKERDEVWKGEKKGLKKAVKDAKTDDEKDAAKEALKNAKDDHKESEKTIKESEKNRKAAKGEPVGSLSSKPGSGAGARDSLAGAGVGEGEGSRHTPGTGPKTPKAPAVGG